jgi:hypothetical protein
MVIDKMIGQIETIDGSNNAEWESATTANRELNVCASLWRSIAATIRVPAQAGF